MSRSVRALRTSAVLVPLVVVAATTMPSGSAVTAVAAGATTATVATVVAAAPTKVLIVVEENHTEASALKGMPQLARLARHYGHTTDYKAVTHPSLPNYLAITGGSSFGVKDDNSPSAHHVHGRSVFDQAIVKHHTAKLYAESMPSNCALHPKGRYAVKHNPWAYFSDKASRSNCRAHDVPAGTTSKGALRTDVDAGTLPDVGMLIPNICNDAHSCSMARADHWLRTWMTTIEHGADWKAGRLAVIVTFDEDDYHGGNTVLTTVMAPRISHVVAHTAYTHYSLTRYADYLADAQPLRHARKAHSIRPAFGL